MNNTCPAAPSNKKEYIQSLGKILVQDYGKKKYYKPREVKKANEKTKNRYHLDFSCWGMSTFSSHEDFDKYHEETGEICDYTAMKTEMLAGFSTEGSDAWIDFSSVDIDMSWLDFGDAFDGILDGIGELFSGILDGLS